MSITSTNGLGIPNLPINPTRVSDQVALINTASNAFATLNQKAPATEGIVTLNPSAFTVASNGDSELIQVAIKAMVDHQKKKQSQSIDLKPQEVLATLYLADKNNDGEVTRQELERLDASGDLSGLPRRAVMGP
jgi:spore germination protein GerM